MAKELDATVQKYGEAIVIRIPLKEASRLGINVGDHVRVRMQRMKLVPVEEVETAPANSKQKPMNGLRRKTTGNLFSMKVQRVAAPRAS